MTDLFEEFLLENLKSSKNALENYRRKKRILLEEDASVIEPHEDDEAEDNKSVVERPAKKLKKKKSPVTGPCVGRIWLDPPEEGCPGPEANRGRNPEADAKKLSGARYNKKMHPMCVSCKREYTKFRKANKE